VTDTAGLFAALMFAVALTCAGRLVVAVRAHRRWLPEVPHIVMGLGMAVMFVPNGPPIPQPWGALVLVAVAGLALVHRAGPVTLHLHGVTGCLAMAYLFAVPAGPIAVNALLAVYFMAEVAWSGVGMAVATEDGTVLFIGPRIGTACHTATGIAMTYMLLTMA
jgi:putative copper export protein